MMQSLLSVFFLLSLTKAIVQLPSECGIVKLELHPSKFVVGGDDVFEGEWPWHVPLFRKPGKYFCGSSLISEQHLLSAAHCFADFGSTYRLPDYYALPGRFDLSSSSERHWVNRSFAAIHTNEEFDDRRSSKLSLGDIALVKMSEKVPFERYIQPICLPAASTGQFAVGAFGLVIGYGLFNDSRKFEDTPKQGALQSVSLVDCLLKDSDYQRIVSKKSFCAGGRDVTPCRGDSGGAFFMQNEETQRFEAVGVISYGIVRAVIGLCDPDEYVVFSDVAQYRDWIDQKLSIPDPVIEMPLESSTAVQQADPCLDLPCGPNAACLNNNGLALCSCHGGFAGSPPSCFQPECQNDNHCPSDRACLVHRCTDLCSLQRCDHGLECETVDHQRRCSCLPGHRHNSRGQCERNPNVIEGTVGSKKCCEWTHNVWPINRTLQKFTADRTTRIPTSDFEIAPRYKSDEVELFELIHWCTYQIDLCHERTNVKHLPTKVHRIFPNLVAFYAEHYAIESATKATFEKLVKLQFLNLFSNLLKVIDVDAFEDLAELRSLNLAKNNLQSLSPRLFESNGKLERIYLIINQLTSLSPQLFAHLPQLTELSLCRNQLHTFDETTFDGLSQLKMLTLCSNTFRELPPNIFARLTQLEKIYMHSNPQLATLPETVFAANRKLVAINLESCGLNHLSSKLFEDKPQLAYVTLRANPCTSKIYGNHDLKTPLTEEQRFQLKYEVEFLCTLGYEKNDKFRDCWHEICDKE